MVNLSHRLPKSKQLADSIVDDKTDISVVSGTYKNCDNVFVIGYNEFDGIKRTKSSSDIENSTKEITDDLISYKSSSGMYEEAWWQITVQVGIPFLIAGMGTIVSGVILGRVEHWDVFKLIPELFILISPLAGLKGNLDMTLSSRLSTQANLGNMLNFKNIFDMVIGNVALVQVQATVTAFVISIFALLVGLLQSGEFQIDHALLLTTSAVFTATTSCFFMNFVLAAMIVISNRYNVNPDNLATPIAASIGDLLTVILLSFSTFILHQYLSSHLWVTYIMLACFFLLIPLWTILILKNRFVRPVLKSGWLPILLAALISGLGGIVLKSAVEQFTGYVVFKPIMNGIGGNLVSVQASRISTMLHQTTQPGIMPTGQKIFELPWKALIYGTPYSKAARIFLIMSIPGQVLFIFIADFLHMSKSTIGAPFVFSYIIAALVLLILLLYIAHVLIHAMWKFKIDPDNSAIPYLTALGDLFGSCLLLAAFTFLRAIGHEYDP
ncbi:hypothetical protein PVAND_017538 [Polypedilum vanderplanki]|uniref:SLC41A/MgtE integral membrane domain-containing protein n=1 Tax=Polypedilum vanderplanki TaxID=319348 RepID=A0A9J6BJT9_POLVA|nr:hypothetical protein PVAND_017538 [Polypedilum vanderplanki]